MRTRKQIERNECVFLLCAFVIVISFAVFGGGVMGWLQIERYAAHVCKTVPNHYSCERSTN